MTIFNKFNIKKMCKNSLMLENEKTGEIVYISRRCFNTLMENPGLPTTIVEKETPGCCRIKWLAVPMIFQK